jgi:hypothetical protein
LIITIDPVDLRVGDLQFGFDLGIGSVDEVGEQGQLVVVPPLDDAIVFFCRAEVAAIGFEFIQALVVFDKRIPDAYFDILPDQGILFACDIEADVTRFYFFWRSVDVDSRRRGQIGPLEIVVGEDAQGWKALAFEKFDICFGDLFLFSRDLYVVVFVIGLVDQAFDGANRQLNSGEGRIGDETGAVGKAEDDVELVVQLYDAATDVAGGKLIIGNGQFRPQYIILCDQSLLAEVENVFEAFACQPGIIDIDFLFVHEPEDVEVTGRDEKFYIGLVLA